MAKYKYIVQLRRGWKYNSDPKTGNPRDDWAKYTEEQPTYAIPLPGELVLEYDNGTPRLKIGDGVHSFAELAYMGIDSFILPTQASVVLDPQKWQSALDANGTPIPNRYYQPVRIINASVTSNSKIDLQPSPEQLLIFKEKDITFTVVNENGNVRVCVIGQKPNNAYTIQATVTEVVSNDKIIGSTTATPYDIQSLINRITALENKINNT